MISLCMIVANEERNIEKFLKNIKSYVDEIIIVDTGSKEHTKEIAAKFTDKIYDFKWNDDFSAARNFSISKATQDWILIMDPDEIISEEDMIRLKEMIKNNKKDVLGYRLIQETYYKGRKIGIRGICRLFMNNKQIKFIYPIHESVRDSIKALNGKIAKTGIVIKHHPQINKEKTRYYLRLLEKKRMLFPDSKFNKEIENELKFNITLN